MVQKKTKAKRSEPKQLLEKYELMIIFKPLLPEDVRSKLVKSIQDQISATGGSVSVKDNWGKRHLAYRIDGQEEGYYMIYNLELDRAETIKFKRTLSLMTDIIRFMMVKESEL